MKVPGLKGRTTARESYRVSQRVRKRVEEIFRWVKTVGGSRRRRYRGRERTQAWGCFVAGTYNLLRVARLELVRPTELPGAGRTWRGPASPGRDDRPRTRRKQANIRVRSHVT